MQIARKTLSSVVLSLSVATEMCLPCHCLAKAECIYSTILSSYMSQYLWFHAQKLWMKYCRKCQQCKIPCFKDCNGAIRYKVQNYVAIQEEQVSDPHCYSFSCVQQAKDPTFTSIKLIYVRVDCVISFESSYWQKGLWPWCWIKMSFCYKGLIKLLTTRP